MARGSDHLLYCWIAINCFISHCKIFWSLNLFYNSAVISKDHALTAKYLPQINKCKSNTDATKLSFWVTMIFTICNCTNIDYWWWTKHSVQVFEENGSEYSKWRIGESFYKSHENIGNAFIYTHIKGIALFSFHIHSYNKITPA